MELGQHNPIKIFSTKTLLDEILGGLSYRTWQRMEERKETPRRTYVSPSRFGYRADDVKAWLDARRKPLRDPVDDPPVKTSTAKVRASARKAGRPAKSDLEATA